MRLHRPSLTVGIAVGLLSVAAVGGTASAAMAFGWPWDHPTSLPQVSEIVTGSVSCSNVASLDGYGGNPGSLTLTYNGQSTTLPWPFELRDGAHGNIFRPPTYEQYRVQVTVPAGQKETTVHWTLACRDQSGSPSSTKEGDFTVARSALSRTICSYGGLLHPCTGPALADNLDKCAYALVNPYIGNAVTSWAKTIDANMHSSDLAKILTAAGKVNPFVGLAVACWPAAKGIVDAAPLPTPPPTTLPPLPPVSNQPLPHLSTAPAPGSGPSTQPRPPAQPAPSSPAAPPVNQPQPPTTPAQPPPAYFETVGGPTHTWTNYTNAGGYEGPTIASYTTVQIACKLQGFKVQDGNTWWYRIATSPWNDQYYASADAFYNNGQTSGSLRGTPWVDPNVPDC